MSNLSLPGEIISSILDLLTINPERETNPRAKPLRIGSYATISREWQAQVERRTFTELVLTPRRLKTALTSKALLDMASPTGLHRVGALRTIDLRVVLPDYDEAARERVETDAEKAENNAVFTQTVRDLFELLSRGDRAGAFNSNNKGLCLNILACCASDTYGGASYERFMDGNKDGKYLYKMRYKNSFLRLDRTVAGFSEHTVADKQTTPDTTDTLKSSDGSAKAYLPLLPMVTRLSAEDIYEERYFHPADVILIASRLPRLRIFNARFSEEDKRNTVQRRARRHAFSRAIPHLPSSLREVYLHVEYEVQDQTTERPRPIIDPVESSSPGWVDPLSAALGRLASRVCEFQLSASITDDFWDAFNAEAATPGPSHKPPVTGILIALNPVLPNGTWLSLPYENDEDYDLSDKEYLEVLPEICQPLPEDLHRQPTRWNPDPTLWSAMLRKAGQAVAYLPNLQDFDMSIAEKICAVRYYLPHRAVYFASRDATTPSHFRFSNDVPLTSPHVFHPDDEILEIWREATKTQLHPDEAELKIQNIQSYEYAF